MNPTDKNKSLTPSLQEMDQLLKFCDVLSKAQFYQKLGAGGVLAIFLTSRELGVPFMTALNGGMYNIEGKVVLSAQLMNMMIIQAGHFTTILNLDEKECRIQFCRSDRKGAESKFEYSYTIDQAKSAGYLNKDNWKKHPKDMLFARCLSGGAKKFMPDVIMNAYVAGELEDDKNSIDAVCSEISEEEKQNESPTVPSLPGLAKINEETKVDGYDEFCQQNEIFDGSLAKQYINHVGQIGKIPEIVIINAAVKDPERFEKGFEKWKNTKK